MRSSTDTPCHHEAARLLAWYVNDTLSAPQSRQVADHLADCAICRADADALQPLRTLLRAPSTVAHTPQAGLTRLLARIDAAEAPASETPLPAPARATGRGGRGPVRWLAAAVVVQAVALSVLAAALLGGRHAGDAAPYQTLTSPAAPAIAESPALRVVFAPELTLGDWQALLRQQDLRVLSGPSDAGLFTLALPPGPHGPAEVQAALQRLRADPRVRFAEPLGTEPAAR